MNSIPNTYSNLQAEGDLIKPTLPDAAGVGFKSTHFEGLLKEPGSVEWIEIHAENYMGDGGRPFAQLDALTDRFQLSVHGVGLSIGGEEPLDPEHLKRIKRLLDRVPAASFSEHLAWSSHDGAYLNDLLPLPYTETTLKRIAEHIDSVQQLLGRQMLLENPSSYLIFTESTMSEVEFLTRIVELTGCGLLLDVNNVFVSATNISISAEAYTEAFPLDAVGEIHLAGYDEDRDENDAPLLIDNHGREVSDPVWELLEFALRRSGPKPVLIEWDNNVPEWPILRDEAEKATAYLSAIKPGIHATGPQALTSIATQ